MVGEMFAEQPKNDLFRMLNTVSLLLLASNFPDIIHLQKGKSQWAGDPDGVSAQEHRAMRMPRWSRARS